MLEGAHHAHAGNLLARQPFKMLIAQHDGAARRLEEAGQAVEDRGFSRAVRTGKAQYGTGLCLKAESFIEAPFASHAGDSLSPQRSCRGLLMVRILIHGWKAEMIKSVNK